jgi:hypothetical protein
MRFQRRIKILPGITLNVGKTGVSASAGPRGAKVTVGKTGIRTTVGLPGTGLSHTELHKPDQPATPAPENETINLLIGIGFIAFLIGCAWVISKVF